MPIKEAVYKSSLTNEITNFIEQKRKNKNGNEGDVEFLSVIDFIEKFKLLPYGLYPVQKFIVKLYYNLPLDDSLKTIKITDKFNKKTLHNLTEAEYLRFLHDQGRCNISEQDGKHRRELILCIGRRSGKSSLSAIFAAYEIYKLLRRGNPQAFYGMPGGSEIRVLCVANDKEQASIVYGDMQSHVESVDYFKNSIANTTQTFLKFRTENDRKKFGDSGKGTITATFKSSIAKGLRGRGVICSILDEIAFFVDDGRCISLNSLILTDSGPQRLGDILNSLGVDRNITGWTKANFGIVKENGEPGIATAVYYGGVKQVKTITTKFGYSITCTDEHRLKVMSASGNIIWKYVSDIKTGDFIGINRKTDLWPHSYYDVSKISRNPSIPKDTIQYSSYKIDHEIDSFSLPDVFDEKYGALLGLLTGDEFRNKRNSIDLNVYGDEFKNFLIECGYDLSNPKHKKTPWVIFRSPKSVVSRYLSGLFDNNCELQQDNGVLSFSTSSRRLAEETQNLLLNFGIICSLNANDHLTKDPRFTLRILDAESRKIFSSEIGFISFWREPGLAENVSRFSNYTNKIPYQRDRLNRIIDTIKLEPSLINSEVLNTELSSRLGNEIDNDLSYEDARQIVHLLGRNLSKDSLELSYICETNYYWDLVTDIKVSKEEVADLRVPEGAQYVAQGMTNHNSGAERIYGAITPSLAQFSPRDPLDKLRPIGPSEGRMILISSPDAKEGFFYRLYQQAMANSKGSADMLVIQAPTWEVNPTLDSSYYEKEYHKNPAVFMTEHGAEFSDRVRGWIEDSNDLMECIDTNHKPVFKGAPREIHFAGIDVGLVNDGTCIAITRINDGKIELVYHEVWYAKKSWKESNPHLSEPLTSYAYTLQDQIRLDMSEIAVWFKALSNRFYIHKAVFDQWSGIVFEQELHKNGLKQFEIRNMFTSDSSQMYQTFKMFMYNRQLKLYNYPRPKGIDGIESGRHSPLITELLELQASSGGKNIINVEAPNAPGKHDDMSDALARAVMLASEYITANPGVLDKKLFARSTDNLPQRIPTYHQYHRMRNALHGGSSIRVAPRSKKR